MLQLAFEPQSDVVVHGIIRSSDPTSRCDCGQAKLRIAALPPFLVLYNCDALQCYMPRMRTILLPQQ